MPPYVLVVPAFIIGEAALCALVVWSSISPSMAWLRPYSVRILAWVTIAFAVAHAGYFFVTSVLLHIVQQPGGGPDLIAFLLLVLELVGPFVASGVALVVGIIVGVVTGRRASRAMRLGRITTR
jgi:hypothetical protein